MSKYYMKTYVSNLTEVDLRILVKTYRIPLDLHSRLLDPALTMDHLPNDTIGIYTQSLRIFGLRIPFSTFLLSVMKYFEVHISQLIPLGLNKVVSFEIVCLDLGIIPTVALFQRHSHSCISDDLPTDSYDRDDVARLGTRLIRLREINEAALVRFVLSFAWSNPKCDPVFRKKDDSSEMSVYDFMTLPTWENAKFVEEPHEFASSILQRVQSNTTSPDTEGPSEPDQSRRKRRMRRKSLEAGSSTSAIERAQDTKGADFSDYCTLLEDTLDRDEGTSFGAVFAPPLRLANVGSYRKARAEVIRRQIDHLDTLAWGAFSHDQDYDEIPEDDFATASLGEVIDLTIFPLTPGPCVMAYPFVDCEGSSSLEYTRQQWDRPYVTPPKSQQRSGIPLGVLLHCTYTQVTENDLKRDV
nr:hypothetical protein [Tanacetum cinerariifolium]